MTMCRTQRPSQMPATLQDCLCWHKRETDHNTPKAGLEKVTAVCWERRRWFRDSLQTRCCTKCGSIYLLCYWVFWHSNRSARGVFPQGDWAVTRAGSLWAEPSSPVPAVLRTLERQVQVKEAKKPQSPAKGPAPEGAWCHQLLQLSLQHGSNWRGWNLCLFMHRTVKKCSFLQQWW